MTDRGRVPSDPAVRDAWDRNPKLATRHRLYAGAYYLGMSEKAFRVRLIQLGILPGQLPDCPTCAGALGYDFDLDRFFCEGCADAWIEISVGPTATPRLEKVM